MINLSKGESINLTKITAGLKSVTMGLGWQGKDGRTLDLDSYVALQDADGNNLAFVYFGDLNAPGVRHKGDDLTGGGSVDAVNEEIVITLVNLPSNCTKIVCGLFIYSGASNLSQVDYAFVKISDQSKNDIVKYNINENFGKSKSITVGELTKNANGEWTFDANGKGERDSYQNIKSKYSPGRRSGNTSTGRRRGLLGRVFGS